MTRRAPLGGAAGAVGASLLKGDRLFGQQARPEVPADPTKVQGAPASDLGQRSPFEQPRRTFSQRRTSSRSPLQHLDGIVTPTDLHFERHHGGVPAVDLEQYSLLIHGMVDRPTVFSLADLKRFPSRSMLRFLECSGNGGEAYRGETSSADVTPQQIGS